VGGTAIKSPLRGQYNSKIQERSNYSFGEAEPLSVLYAVRFHRFLTSFGQSVFFFLPPLDASTTNRQPLPRPGAAGRQQQNNNNKN